jgi:hypothetical protein
MQRGQKAWDYSHTEHAYPVVHVFQPANKDLNKWPILKQKLGLVQQVESNNHLRGGVVNLYNTMETSWIVAMHKMGYRYACIWFDGAWADTHEFNSALLTEIDRLNSNEWLAAGQIQARDDEYPFFTRNCVLLNIATWMAQDQPNPHVQPPVYPNYVAVDGFEDSCYSLVEAEPTDLSWMIFNKAQHFANAWIAWSLRRHIAVPGLSDDFTDTITFTRPINGTDEFQKGISGEAYDPEPLSHRAKYMCNRLTEVSSPIYFVNTENSRPETASALVGTNFEQYVGPCAGFKLLYYAYKYGIGTSTDFLFYDFDPDSVQFKRDTLKHWNGDNFVAWVKLWIHAHPGVNTELEYQVQEKWATTLEQFGGERSFKQFWARVQACNWQCVHVDLINDWDKLVNTMNNKRTFFWSSNIYSYMPIKLSSPAFAMENSFINIIKTLNAKPDSWFSGTDINDNDLMCPSTAILSVQDNNNIGFE